MKKRWCQVLVVGMCVCVLCLYASIVPGVTIVDDPVALGENIGTLIREAETDVRVIPDIYNTGVKGDLIPVELASTINGIRFKSTTAASTVRNVLDFAYSNKAISGTVCFENYDFSDNPLGTSNEQKVDRAIKVVFNNCKFSAVSVGRDKGKMSYEFNNCTIESFYGSNAVFNNCQFGRSYKDGMVPYQNVVVKDCFFLDMSGQTATTKSMHVDATQIYGTSGIDVQDVYFDNCRFEIPPIREVGSSAKINACIMLQLEFSNAKNVAFTDCIVNGGGYSIYAWAANTGYTLENVEFNGIRFGCAKQYGILHPQVSSSIALEDMAVTETLYVGSVWKEDANTHFSVSNDTAQERKFTVITSEATYEYEIPACPSGTTLAKGSYSYEDLPFDVNIVVPEDCLYAVCYDSTLDGYVKQIRFVNWSGKDVFLDSGLLKDFSAKADEVIASGMCGKAVEYTVTKAGVLTLRGTGNTTAYHSAKLPPWDEYKDTIREIRIEDGIEAVCGQIFRKCVAVQSVSLPNTLKSIGGRAFAGCSSLMAVKIPASVADIGDSAFEGTPLRAIYYQGSDWNDIVFGTGNSSLEGKVVYVEVADEDAEEAFEYEIIMQGRCGNAVEYTLDSNGTLRIVGEGAMYNYHSAKRAPWYDNRELIRNVVFDDGIEELGSQLFVKCKQLESVKLPAGINEISGNCFLGCSSLIEIEIPESVKSINSYAFHAAGIERTIYRGTPEQWAEITIGSKNGTIADNVIFE